MSVTQLHTDLATDRIITLQQAQSHYSLSKEDIEASAGLKIHADYIGKTAYSKRHPKVEFVTLTEDRSIRRKRPPELRHFAATAELRHVVGAKIEDWEVIRSGLGKASLADALWQHPKGYEVAIEFDAGSYSIARVVEKTEAWSREGKQQVWGISSKPRVKTLKEYLPETVPIHFLDFM